ncbi:hypothetical protein [Kutzneria sp. 744]|uniref:hypothetical protein n=1 Tax=Kutzneria sp. (strain 744) TaxID=345341 RepID=UPI0003EED731|nr:hypothetical protein [Kutzneria sp. 744]EWM12216.1 hypothetical protein KUTG_02520 [Kutzneria sp. 744]
MPRTVTELLADLRVSDRRVVLLTRANCRTGTCRPGPSRWRRCSAGPGSAPVTCWDPGADQPQWLPAFFGIAVSGAAASAPPMPPVVLDAAAAVGQLRPIVEAGRIRHIVAAGVARALAEQLPGLVVVGVLEPQSTSDTATLGLRAR